MPSNPGLGPAVEDGLVLGHGHVARGLVERGEVDVLGAAVAGAQLLARDRERRAHLGERAGRGGAGRSTPSHGASAIGSVRPRFVAECSQPLRAGEVDEPARGERGDEPLARLLVDQRPSRRR